MGEHLVFVRIAFQEKIFVIASVISSCNQSGVITLDIFGPLEKPCHVDVSIRGLGMRNCGWKWGVADLNWARCPMDRICEQRLRLLLVLVMGDFLHYMVIATSAILEDVTATARNYPIAGGPCTK